MEEHTNPPTAGENTSSSLGVSAFSNNNDAPRFPSLVFDPEKYRQYVRDFDLSEAEQEELLQAIWAIMVAFVDFGMKIHPVQLVIKDVNERDAALALGGVELVDSCPASPKRKCSKEKPRRPLGRPKKSELRKQRRRKERQ